MESVHGPGRSPSANQAEGKVERVLGTGSDTPEINSNPRMDEGLSDTLCGRIVWLFSLSKIVFLRLISTFVQPTTRKIKKNFQKISTLGTQMLQVASHVLLFHLALLPLQALKHRSGDLIRPEYEQRGGPSE